GGPGPYGGAPQFGPAGYAQMGGPIAMAPPAMGPMPASAGMPAMPTPDYAGDGYGGGGYGGGGYGGNDGCDGWGYRINTFGEFLYLRPRNTEVAYAVPVVAAGAAAGNFSDRVGVADPDFGPGFRGGFGMATSNTG